VNPVPENQSAAATLFDSVEQIFAEEARLREQPATDEQLREIWPLWNVLPAEMIPENKSWILGGAFVDTHREHRELLDKLRGVFPKVKLPLDRNAYHQALEQAARWSGLIRYVQTTFELHKAVVEAQLDYSTFDDVLSGRVAIYRTARELEKMQPKLLAQSAPALADIQHLVQRYDAYMRARQDAIGLLHPLVFLKSLHSKRALPFDERAIGLPHPPEDFPDHIYIARLLAFGKCSPKRQAEFFAERFLKLTHAQMNEFTDEFHRPTEGRRGKYLFFAVWLADNAPLFNAFKLTWADILDTARQHFNERSPDGYRDCPENPDNLKVFWKEQEDRLWPGQPRRITPPTGRPRANDMRAVPDGLLTPLPFVSAVQKG